MVEGSGRWRRFGGSVWGRRALLVALTAAPAGVEASATRLTGFIATPYIAPQASALWPYGTFHDLRWVLVYHHTWAGFIGESLAAITARGVLCTALTALAWPVNVPRPSLGDLARRNLLFAAVLGAFLSPWAALGVVASDVALSWYVFGEIAPLIVMAPFLQRGGMVPGWWRGMPPAGTIGLSLLNFVTLTAGSAVVSLVPRGWTIVLAAAVGGANGLLWERAVQVAVAHKPVGLPRVPVAPIAVIVVIGLMFTIGWITNLQANPPRREEPAEIEDLEAKTTKQPTIFLAGYNSRYDGEPSGYDLPVIRYSYTGLDSSGQPRPYAASATHQSLVTSAQLLAKQVDDLHHRTGENVSLLGESEGALISRYYLTTMPHTAVTMLAMLSPPLRSGRVYYPPRAANTGYGIATGWELRAIFGTLGRTGGLPSSADEPLIRSLLDSAPLLRGKRLVCPTNGVKIIAFVPALDAITVPPGLHAEVPVVQIPGIHGLLIDNPLVRTRLLAFLNHERAQPQTTWEYTTLQRAGTAWQAPVLQVSLNPAEQRRRPTGPRLPSRHMPPTMTGRTPFPIRASLPPPQPGRRSNGRPGRLPGRRRGLPGSHTPWGQRPAVWATRTGSATAQRKYWCTCIRPCICTAHPGR